MQLRYVCAAVLFATLIPAGASAAEGGPLRAGAARIDITPSMEYALAIVSIDAGDS